MLGGLTVGKDDLKLVGAVKVTAENGINLKVAINTTPGTTDTDSGTAFNSGAYVMKGSVVGVYSTGTTAADAIDASKGENFGAKAGNKIQANANIVLKNATEVEIGAGMTGISITALNKVTNINGKIAEGAGSIWVVPGESFDVTGSVGKTLTVTEAGAAADHDATITASGNTAKITVGTNKISITEAP